MAGVPTGLMLLPHGASLSGDTRCAAIELKGIGNAAVFKLFDDTVLLPSRQPVPQEVSDHLTIHGNLMVHLRDRKGRRRQELRAAADPTGFAGARHLVSIGSGATDRPPRTGRLQRSWDGASILSFERDPNTVPGQTQLVVDIWALGRFDPETRFDSVLPNLRATRSSSGSASLGPWPPHWAFWRKLIPCGFFFTFWSGEPDPDGRPVVSPG